MRSALGKGLDALLSEDTVASVTAAGAVVSMLPIARIKPNPKQPRRHFAPGALSELTASIRQRGVLQPILVTASADGNYEIIAGERRWRAAQSAGQTEIPALIRAGTPVEHFETALIENVQREDLNPIELAQGYQRLHDEFRMTQEAIAQVVGKDRAVIANTLRLLNLPASIQQALTEEKITAGHARALAALEDPAAQSALFRQITADHLTVRAVEQAVRSQKAVRVREHVRAAGYETRSADVKAIEDDLQKTLGRKVELRTAGPASHKGWIKLEFYSLDDLDQLIARLKKAPPA